MGEVYIKITSDNPSELVKNQKALKKKFIILYTLEFSASILNLVMIIWDSEGKTSTDNMYWVIILLFILIVASVFAQIVHQFLKYYIFFAKLKFSKDKQIKEFSCQRTAVKFWHIFMISFVILYTVVLLTEFTLYAVKSREKDFLNKATEFRKAMMFGVLHLNAFSILLLFYYVARNQQRK